MHGSNFRLAGKLPLPGWAAGLFGWGWGLLELLRSGQRAALFCLIHLWKSLWKNMVFWWLAIGAGVGHRHWCWFWSAAGANTVSPASAFGRHLKGVFQLARRKHHRRPRCHRVSPPGAAGCRQVPPGAAGCRRVSPPGVVGCRRVSLPGTARFWETPNIYAGRGVANQGQAVRLSFCKLLLASR